MISAVATAAAFGVLGAFAPVASATTPTTTPPTSEVAGYPPVPTSSTTTTQAESLGPVVVTPPADVDDAAIAAAADLPSTGSDSMVPLRVAGALLVAGVLAVFAVRRRRRSSPEPAT
jgi:LPXTG-motif cell wall-anchored protein